jgi:hypothetical protein
MPSSCSSIRLAASPAIPGRERCFYKRLDDGAWHAVDPVLKDPDTIYGG